MSKSSDPSHFSQQFLEIPVQVPVLYQGYTSYGVVRFTKGQTGFGAQIARVLRPSPVTSPSDNFMGRESPLLSSCVASKRVQFGPHSVEALEQM
jgi:hypothetical protein